jgi:hypothetical protein
MSAFLFDGLAARKQREAYRTLQRSQYVARLAAVLGRGADWEYRGECQDLQMPSGKCSCGHHGLRYLFTIHHKTSGRRAIVGSSCVETFPGISPELAAQLGAEADRLEANARQRAEIARQSKLAGPRRLFVCD